MWACLRLTVVGPVWIVRRVNSEVGSRLSNYVRPYCIVRMPGIVAQVH